MSTFITLKLHQLIDPKARLNISKMNNQKSNDIARSYQRRCRGGREDMSYRLLQTVLRFFLKEAIVVGLCTLSGRSFHMLRASKANLWPKCLTDL